MFQTSCQPETKRGRVNWQFVWGHVTLSHALDVFWVLTNQPTAAVSFSNGLWWESQYTDRWIWHCISVSYALLSNVLSGNTRQAGFLDVLSSRVNCASCGTSNGGIQSLKILLGSQCSRLFPSICLYCLALWPDVSGCPWCFPSVLWCLKTWAEH